MSSKYNILPDLLDENITRICSAPIKEDQYLEGLDAKKDKCLMVYDESTRNEVLETWERLPYEWFHLSGGWRNPMTAEFKFFRDQPGDVPFKERMVGDYEEHLPIEFDYLNNWREMIRDLNKEISEKDFRNMEISDLLKMGAPPYWDLKAEGKIIARSTSAPFPGTELEMGYIVCEKQPEFKDKTFNKSISNTTGARGFGTIGLNHLLTYLQHDENKVEEIFIKEAEWRNEQSKATRGRELPFSGREDVYAQAFVETAGLVKDEILELLDKYGTEASGFQYACIIYVVDQIPASVSKFPKSVPHAFIKTEDGWKRADI